MNNKVLVIIPARGGSKGIPRKNLRNLAGKPLIAYAVNNALSSSFSPDVYVSSEDAEIISIAKKLGAKTILRDERDSLDSTTLDPVIFNSLKIIEGIEEKEYDIVVTLQPTSPLLKTKTIDSAIHQLINNPSADTLISAVDDTHLTWSKINNKYKPNYKARLNRQELPNVFKETGGFLITRAECITSNSRIGPNVELVLVSEKESIDIDTYADWGLCEYYLRRKKLIFVVSGFREIGLGHVYNTLLLANDLIEHEISFLVDTKSQLAFEKISSKNYKVIKQTSVDIVDDIVTMNPDLVINDMLDTDKKYIQKLKNHDIKIVNIEDLGSGAKLADITINAIYPEKDIFTNHYFGHKYFILRDEFLLTKKVSLKKKVKKVLLSFGGVDPNNFTKKVLSSIYRYCQNADIKIEVITGFGYKQQNTLKHFGGVKIHHDVQNISDLMVNADVIFTSAGRTTYEIASLAIPAIVLAQNERELTHLFANKENGFINLGLGTSVEEIGILNTLKDLLDNFIKRQNMSQKMSSCDLMSGRARVVSLIREVLNT